MNYEPTIQGLLWYAKGWLHCLSATMTATEVGLYLFEAQASFILAAVKKVDSGLELSEDDEKQLAMACTKLLKTCDESVKRKLSYRCN